MIPRKTDISLIKISSRTIIFIREHDIDDRTSRFKVYNDEKNRKAISNGHRQILPSFLVVS